jgi:hypothetical protein
MMRRDSSGSTLANEQRRVTRKHKLLASMQLLRRSCDGGLMFAQWFESFRKASEAALQAQQDIFKQWVQQWPSAPMGSAGGTSEWNEALRRRWVESTKEALNKHRQVLDTSYHAGIQLIEQTFRVGEAKSPEEYRHMVEELWRNLSDSFKNQSEAQFRDFQAATERWFEAARNGGAANGAEGELRYRDAGSSAQA